MYVPADDLGVVSDGGRVDLAGLVAEEDGGSHYTSVEVHLEYLVARRWLLPLGEGGERKEEEEEEEEEEEGTRGEEEER